MRNKDMHNIVVHKGELAILNPLSNLVKKTTKLIKTITVQLVAFSKFPMIFGILWHGNRGLPTTQIIFVMA